MSLSVIIEPNEQSAAFLARALEERNFQHVLIVNDAASASANKAASAIIVFDAQQRIEVEKGGDKNVSVHCLEKPYRVGGLLALLLRAAQTDSVAPVLLLMGKYQLNTNESVLMRFEGDAIKLTDKERDILIRLHDGGGAAIDRQTLLESVWGYGENIETHTLETHIYRLRQKIESNPAEPEFLITTDEGYALVI